MSNLYRGPFNDAHYQVSAHLAKRFQRRRFLEINESETKIACVGYVSSVSGPNRPITPYVKPFFTPQLRSQPSLITALTPFHRVSRLCEFFMVLFARVSRFNHVFTL